MTITYEYEGALYVNLTNRCNCNCEFCLRHGKAEGSIYTENSLWLEHEPTHEEAMESFLSRDICSYREIVFCGYGEPTYRIDEIFALVMAEKGTLTVPFMLGLGTTPILGWTAGTLCGALAGSVLPASIRVALGVMLYGMFIAIVVPPARQEKPVLITVILALVLSCMFAWIPMLQQVSAGISIVICTVAAAAICAWLHPIEEEEAQA